MNRFWKHLAGAFIWLLVSEILCLILSFSIAILSAKLFFSLLGCICCLTAHISLLGHCAQKAAAEDAAAFRMSGEKAAAYQPVLISVCIMLPAYLTYFLLMHFQENILLLNLFPLMNAPFLQIYRFLIQNTEPFSALPSVRKALMAIPPLITGIAWYLGYQIRSIREAARIAARTNRT